jgi:hypothetical protein
MHLGELDRDVRIELTYSVYLPNPEFEFDVVALVNGAPIDTWTERGWSGWQRTQRSLIMPLADCQGIATWLTFKCTPRSESTPQQVASLALHAIEVRVE